ncbi:hypothetical protein Pla175_02680 [Pirellulimonas nuda]|uniref:Uncharacterized protein n=1 Tax=Pirellulimonas nuda TaxID=2528009 RepID=A0A518D617_9BACT|nr:hypothetical protein [Pirellulimonas nuda]QDU86914.1 hypothetical protein Pla175_02680 [Pirellulimonas nuda]
MRFTASPIASCLLTAALVYQMGVCPCGCDEHNVWLEAVRAAVGDQDTHSHPPTDTPAFDHAHCGCAPQAAYCSAVRVAADQQVSVCCFAAAGTHGGDPLAPTLPGASISDFGDPLQDAPTLRAQLQVYRI